ncbi:MAG: sulfurtransferase TusA family protein [Rhodobacteraceae bacterium]|jgi:tRNA 2-thiouridine synthesizing protein A|nr:sulfurtransferase TusA family protein [Paracoccaceae bacterium]
MADMVLDAKDLTCPLPILRAKKALKELAPGMILEVQATDPGAPRDFEAFCRTTGNDLVEQREDGGIYYFTIRHGG